MTEFVAALVAAGATFLVAWWGQPGRKAVAIHRYAELLNDLPADSKQRERLAAEIDKMVGDEIDGRRIDEVMQIVWMIFAFAAIAFLANSVAQNHGGPWTVASVVFGGLAIAMVALFVISGTSAPLYGVALLRTTSAISLNNPAASPIPIPKMPSNRRTRARLS